MLLSCLFSWVSRISIFVAFNTLVDKTKQVSVKNPEKTRTMHSKPRDVSLQSSETPTCRPNLGGVTLFGSVQEKKWNFSWTYMDTLKRRYFFLIFKYPFLKLKLCISSKINSQWRVYICVIHTNGNWFQSLLFQYPADLQFPQVIYRCSIIENYFHGTPT